MKGRTIRTGDHDVEVTNLDKPLFPDGTTKGDLIDYYSDISEMMIPLIRDRPLNMHRFPDGIKGLGFFQQEIPEGAPDWVERIAVPKKEGGSVTHILGNNRGTLVYLANLACITPHAWLSRADAIETPDTIVFDLDPSGRNFEDVRKGALLMRDLVLGLGLKPFAKTTGSRGLHVVIPIKRDEGFDSVRGFADDMARMIAGENPDILTTEQRKGERRGRVYIDTLRNSYGQTAVAPYAVRAKDGAPVAAPVFWDEVEDEGLSSQKYNIKNVIEALESRGDPWKGIDDSAVPIDGARARLREVIQVQSSENTR